MISKRFKRMFTVKTASAALAVAMIAAVLAMFAGQASAAHKASGQAAMSCVAVLAAGNTIDVALSELVKDGTLTQVQADAVQAKIGGDAGAGAKACVGAALIKSAGVAEALQTLLGLDAKAIHADIKAGQSLTEIAASKQVDRATLVSTIEKALNTELDKLVASGKLSAARATTLKADIATRVETAVDAHHTGKTPRSATPAATPIT